MDFFAAAILEILSTLVRLRKKRHSDCNKKDETVDLVFLLLFQFQFRFQHLLDPVHFSTIHEAVIDVITQATYAT